MTTDDQYAEIAPFYDLEFDSFDADIELYLGYAQLVGGPVLELGCGTGRLLQPIATAGFDITGIDSSSAMVDLARRRLGDAGLTRHVAVWQGDMRDLSGFDQHEFRLVFIAINSFLHLADRVDQLQTLGEIRRVIHRDGLLVIDVFNPTPDALSRMDDRYAFDAEWSLDKEAVVQRYSHRQLDSAAQTISTRLFYDRIQSDGSVARRTTSYQMRYVHRFELELLLITGGFELEGVYGSYALDPLEHDSENLIVVAHRTANPDEG